MNKHASATPNWWILKIIDGLGAHLTSYKAMKMQYDTKILTVKEEAETSHACQADDSKVAKFDKCHCCAAINAIKYIVPFQCLPFRSMQYCWGQFVCH